MTQEQLILLAPYIAEFLASIIGLIIGKKLFSPYLKARKLSMTNHFDYSPFSLMHKDEKIKFLISVPILFIAIIATPISAQMIVQTNALYLGKIAYEEKIQKLEYQHQLQNEKKKQLQAHHAAHLNQTYPKKIFSRSRGI